MDLHTYLSMDALEMAERIRNKETSPQELVALCLEQLEKVNPQFNIMTADRKEQVIAEAAKWKQPDGLFAGVPILLKNISQAVAGEPLTSGAGLMRDNIAVQDSNFVSRLRKAGFLFVGHTNTPEFGLKNITEPILHGPTRNPWNPDYSPGGSSGGSAAAIAAGVVPVAGASDGGGSIRIPASFSGLFGLKPTRGRTAVGPGAGRQWQGASIDFVLSRTVRDSAALLDISQVIQPEAAFQTPLFPGSYQETMKQDFDKPLRIVYTTKSPVGTPVSADAVKAVEKTITWLEQQGHHVEEKENGVDGVLLMQNYFLMNSGEMAMVIAQLEAALGREMTADDVEMETWLLNIAGKSVSAAAFSASLASWDTAAAQMATLHQQYDLYITPATAFTAPKIGELTPTPEQKADWIARMADANPMKQQELIYEMFLPSLTYTPFTQLANLTGQPAVSLPVHLAENGLPIGVQAMATKGAEDVLLQLAWQIEQSPLWVDVRKQLLENNGKL